MKKHTLNFITVLILCLTFVKVAAQDNTSIFDACNDVTENSKRLDCEKKKILHIINTDLLSYIISIKPSGPESEIWLYFDIEDMGIINDINIFESINNPPRYDRNKINLNTKFNTVRIPDFKSPKKFSISYKVPVNTFPDNNISNLDIQEEGKEIYKVVQKMPRFPGCEDTSETEIKKDNCAKNKMLKYINDNLVYPETAKILEIEGQVILQFIVEPDGWLTNIKSVRDPGFGLGQAAIDVVESMNLMDEKWIPGSQSNRIVRVLLTVPVDFKLKKR
ncbi:MAG: energy transducer TonB [Saprospiraceae bacterium]|nr:energy transducer TonB [Saprospiraceae bacterium]